MILRHISLWMGGRGNIKLEKDSESVCLWSSSYDSKATLIFLSWCLVPKITKSPQYHWLRCHNTMFMMMIILTRIWDDVNAKECAWLPSQTAWQNIWSKIITIMTLTIINIILILTWGFADQEFPSLGNQFWDPRLGNLCASQVFIGNQTN